MSDLESAVSVLQPSGQVAVEWALFGIKTYLSLQSHKSLLIVFVLFKYPPPMLTVHYTSSVYTSQVPITLLKNSLNIWQLKSLVTQMIHLVWNQHNQSQCIQDVSLPVYSDYMDIANVQ